MAFTHPRDAKPGHKWKTRDGRDVEIYTWEYPGGVGSVGYNGYKIVGSFFDRYGWIVHVWDKDGRTYRSHTADDDLVDAEEEFELWVNGYPNNGISFPHLTRLEADRNAKPNRIACVSVRFKAGDGL